MNNNIKLISTDMDGTLLNDNKEFPAKFDEMMKILKEKNITFVAASGRSYPKQEEIFNDYLEQMYFICDNGAIIKHKKQTIYKDTVNIEEMRDLIEECKKINNVFLIFCGNKGVWQKRTPKEFSNHITAYYKPYKIIEDYDEVNDEILKIAICDLNGSANNSYKKLVDKYNDKYSLVVSGENWMDIMKKGINKGKALQFIQNKLGIDKSQSMGFGDFYNDTEMLQCCEYSFVMENANKDMRQFAKYIAPSNNDNGVIRMINKYLFEKE